MDYLKLNLEHHDKAFKGGYGIRYPESHMIRIYERVLKYRLGLSGSRGERLLDFGCGNGVHAAYFTSKGFDVYGVDADPTAIAEAKRLFPQLAKRFETVDAKPNASKPIFGGQFSAIVTNQVLYYLSNTDLDACLDNFHRMLVPGGVVIATMMGSRHYFKRYAKELSDGMHEVTLTGRVKAVSYVNFVHSREDLLKKFARFQAVNVGYYDSTTLEEEGSTYHFVFTGKKA